MHCLPWHDDARHSVGTLWTRQFDLRQAMPVGRDSAQSLRLAALGRMQIDAVEIVSRLLRRNREARLVDEAFQIARLHCEFVADFTNGEIRKVFRRKRLQTEARVARRDRQALLVAFALHFDLGALGQFAHDVVQHMRRNRERAGTSSPSPRRSRPLRVRDRSP